MTRPISRHGINTLRYIRDHEVFMEHLGQVHQGTLGSILQKYAHRNGTRILLNDAGEDALREYESSQWNARQHPGPLTDRVESLLKYARLRVLQKRGAA